jgi:hypothetical protein
MTATDLARALKYREASMPHGHVIEFRAPRSAARSLLLAFLAVGSASWIITLSGRLFDMTVGGTAAAGLFLGLFGLGLGFELFLAFVNRTQLTFGNGNLAITTAPLQRRTLRIPLASIERFDVGSFKRGGRESTERFVVQIKAGNGEKKWWLPRMPRECADWLAQRLNAALERATSATG